jgi:hypothetical protein
MGVVKASMSKPFSGGATASATGHLRRSTGEKYSGTVLGVEMAMGRRSTGELSRSESAKARLEHLKQVQKKISVDRESRAMQKSMSLSSTSTSGGGVGGQVDSRRVSSSSGGSVQAALDELPANIRRAMKRVSLS